MRISEIMTEGVVSVNENDSVAIIAKIMTENKIHGIPVLKNNEVVGIVTETDFFTKGKVNVYLPTYIDILSNDRLFKDASPDERENISRLVSAKARDIMSSPCICINKNAELAELLELVKKKNLRSIPVIDDDGNLCGIATRADLIMMLKI